MNLREFLKVMTSRVPVPLSKNNFIRSKSAGRNSVDLELERRCEEARMRRLARIHEEAEEARKKNLESPPYMHMFAAKKNPFPVKVVGDGIWNEDGELLEGIPKFVKKGTKNVKPDEEKQTKKFRSTSTSRKDFYERQWFSFNKRRERVSQKRNTAQCSGTAFRNKSDFNYDYYDQISSISPIHYAFGLGSPIFAIKEQLISEISNNFGSNRYSKDDTYAMLSYGGLNDANLIRFSNTEPRSKSARRDKKITKQTFDEFLTRQDHSIVSLKLEPMLRKEDVFLGYKNSYKLLNKSGKGQRSIFETPKKKVVPQPLLPSFKPDLCTKSSSNKNAENNGTSHFSPKEVEKKVQHDIETKEVNALAKQLMEQAECTFNPESYTSKEKRSIMAKRAIKRMMKKQKEKEVYEKDLQETEELNQIHNAQAMPKLTTKLANYISMFSDPKEIIPIQERALKQHERAEV